MAEVPELAAPAAAAVERRIVTVLFADLVGFTPLSESLDPEDVASVQDAYFAATRETVERYGGVLEKFIGDAAMAVFGAPRARDDDAERAVRAGLALIGALEQIEAGLGMAAGTLQLRVGINTGEVVHATDGPDAGRVTGDTVNTAARLQAAARPGHVLIGELTALTVAETIETEPIGTVELKGKADAVRAWEAIGARSQPSREEALGALRAPMLGREGELARLTEALAGVVGERRAERVVIIAPPGVGKSRLLAEFGAGADATVLRARVRPQATAPYETVSQLLAAAHPERLPAALIAAGVAPARAAVIGEEVARLLEPGAQAAAGGSDLAAERDGRFEAWIAALDALCDGPQAWLVEDVHWAGGDLLAFLDQAGRAPSREGRLVVATARPSLLESAAAWSEAPRLDLAPLPPTDAEALVHALVGAALPPELVRAVVERSDGTPLFIEELLRTWASVGALVRDGDAWRLAVQPDAVPLPPTVQAIYAAQLDDLPPDARMVARRGSVAGRRVPLAAFEPLDLAGPGGSEGLDALRRRAFLAGPLDDAITGDAYAYRHALLRDAGYASLARAERARLHVAMARWLESVAGDRGEVVAEAVAEHLGTALDSLPALATPAHDRATLAADAAAWYERAAESALGLAAHEAAQRLFARAIELTADDARLDRARRRLRLGEILAASADLGAGIVEMEAALEGFADDPAGASAAAYALGRAYMQQIRFDEAEQLTADTLARLTDAPDALRARLHALHAWSVAAQGRAEGVFAETELALAAAASADDPVLELDVLEHVNAARDEIDEAGLADWALLEEKALAVGRWHQVAVASRIRAVIEADTDPQASVPRLAETAEVASAHGLTEQAGWADYSRTESLWVVGDWDEALAVGERVVALGERYAYDRLAFRTWVILLPIAAARGLHPVADHWKRWWDASASHFPTTPSPYAQILHGAIPVWLAQATGRPVTPPPDVTDAIIPMCNPHFIGAVETLARAWLGAGRTDLAAVAAQRSAAIAAEADFTRLSRASAALLDAWATGSAESARVARDLAREHSAPWWELRALQALGDVPAADEIARSLGVRKSA